MIHIEYRLFCIDTRYPYIPIDQFWLILSPTCQAVLRISQCQLYSPEPEGHKLHEAVRNGDLPTFRTGMCLTDSLKMIKNKFKLNIRDCWHKVVLITNMTYLWYWKLMWLKWNLYLFYMSGSQITNWGICVPMAIYLAAVRASLEAGYVRHLIAVVWPLLLYWFPCW